MASIPPIDPYRARMAATGEDPFGLVCSRCKRTDCPRPAPPRGASVDYTRAQADPWPYCRPRPVKP